MLNPFGCIDLTASRVWADKSGYPGSVKITARFGNGGALHIAPGTDMSFYDGDSGAGGILLGTAATTRQLNPGEYEDLSLTLNSPQPEILTVYAAADDDGTGNGKVSETDEDNNIASGEFYIGNHAPVIISVISKAVEEFQTGQDASPFKAMKVKDWTPVQYVCGGGSAKWEFLDDDTVMQTKNSDAAILLSDVVLQDSTVRGTWYVNSSWDDDWMGFVFGYQDRGHYYLFDWKKEHQKKCLKGMRILLISEDSDTECVRMCINRPVLYNNDIGWQYDTEYEFSLEFHPGEFTVKVTKNGADIIDPVTIQDNTYLTGKFGFYNASQDNVVYKGFEQETLPSDMYIYNVEADDPDNDILTYTLKNSPDGMAIDPATGVITWTPTGEHTGIHNVSVEVSDGRDGTDIQHYTLRVLSAIDAYPVISGNPVVGSELTFTVSDPSGLACEWDFGDGHTAAGSEAVHTYAAQGDYNVVLHVTDSDGKSADIPRTLHIDTIGSPTASMSVSGYMTAGQAISFDGSGSYAQSGMIQSCNWDFGDGHTGSGPAISHIYADAGNYQAVLAVTDTNGLSSAASVSLMIGPNQGPVAGFGYSGVMADGNPIFFDASGSYDPEGQGLSYAWDFGDGSSGMGATPGYTYAVPGDYAVTLTITDSQGQTDSAAMTLTIGSSAGPVAKFSVSGVYSAGRPVNFDGSLSSGSIVSYSWNFGDENTETGVQAVHTYTQAGQFSVVLRVTDSAGAWSEAHGKITVTDEPNQNPGVRITCPATGIVNEAAAFSAAGTDPDGDDLSYSWNFGDSTAGTGASASHTYASAGTYDVTVTVSDGYGGEVSDTCRTEIIQLPAYNVPPEAEAGGPYNGTMDQAVVFDGSGSYDLNLDTVTYTWDFGNNETGSDVSPSYTWHDAGTYEVTLTVTDPEGLAGTDTAEVRIGDPGDTAPPELTLDMDCPDVYDLYAVTGSVSDESSVSYKLQSREKGVSEWITFAQGSGASVSGELG
ncbi:MAG: PKD domain-containing protein, partial [Fuerstiella sp.]|nr:PKD domain-containing protein [Fuerstiella sp.]